MIARWWSWWILWNVFIYYYPHIGEGVAIRWLASKSRCKSFYEILVVHRRVLYPEPCKDGYLCGPWFRKDLTIDNLIRGQQIYVKWCLMCNPLIHCDVARDTRFVILFMWLVTRGTPYFWRGWLGKRIIRVAWFLMALIYEAWTLQISCCIHVRHMSDTNTLWTL